MSKVKIIKTLPHLTSLFIPNEATTVYSNLFSESILKSISSATILKKENIMFSNLLNWISKFSLNTKSEVLDEFRALEKVEYSRVDNIEERLNFSVKGDVINIWLAGYENPLRIEFFGEDCEAISLIDKHTGKKVKDLNFIVLINELPKEKVEILELNINIVTEKLEKIIFTNKDISGISEYYRNIDFNIIKTDFSFPNLYFSKLVLFEKEIARLKELNYIIYINSKHTEILKDKFEKYLDNKILKQISSQINEIIINAEEIKNLPAGFISQKYKIAVFSDRELFGSIFLSRNKKNDVSENTLKKLLRKFEGEINIGDYVVHEDYGIGIYSGLTQEKIEDITNEYLLLKFAESDELYVPLSQISKVTKFLGNDGLPPKLTQLGKGHWQVLKNKVKNSVFLTAKELINHYAKRELSKAIKIKNEDSEEFLKFVNEFPFIETKDQINAINEVIFDLEKEKPMNRVLIGDVGFGKTEVIMRAAFKMVEAKAQVAIIAPTTILTAQHYVVFKDRFKNFPYKIAFLSRFNTTSQNKQIVEKVNKGEIDIIIGTHRLFGNDIKFKNLGLLVADEEQKFGVKQKEKIKKINEGVHVLSVSATPIPRTLSLALSTIQEISIITTPPIGRKAVETEIIFNDWEKVLKAIEFEIKRGGQIYFIHNEVQSIEAIKAKLQKFLPSVRFVTAHGQMNATQLDNIMSSFYHHDFDCLISTSIIENGLDVKNANTVIIHNAHRFGLSQLYQMRGRVGRSSKKAFCYLMCPKPNESIRKVKENLEINATNQNLLENNYFQIQADKKTREIFKKKSEATKLYIDRLQSLVDHQELGSGFNIASKDLEIRGAGNILGEQQHGHISSVGYSLYIEMLADAVEKINNAN